MAADRPDSPSARRPTLPGSPLQRLLRSEPKAEISERLPSRSPSPASPQNASLYSTRKLDDRRLSPPPSPRHGASMPPWPAQRPPCQPCEEAKWRSQQSATAPQPNHPLTSRRLDDMALPPPSMHTREYPLPPTAIPSFANSKRRRAKRSEQERIAYLRSDPYVAKFEAYRVLCASCDKWIRLRPNSTYCSIPWDAHRKSCLTRRVDPNRSAQDVEIANEIFSKEPDIRKFDAERVLCAICDSWIPVQNPKQWFEHRDDCVRAAHRPATSSLGHVSRHPSTSSSQDQALNASASEGSIAVSSSQQSISNRDSRRRNAEHRAATLRADALIREVEPGRVFCSMCMKWVQLRQDSSYCAYPWLQHRGKCLKKSQRRAEKAAHAAVAKAQLHSASPHMAQHPPPSFPHPSQLIRQPASYVRSRDSHSMSDGDEDTDSDEDLRSRKRIRREDDPISPRVMSSGSTPPSSPPANRVVPPSSAGRADASRKAADAGRRLSEASGSAHLHQPPSHREPRTELFSREGRLTFLQHSIRHLMSTTYSPADELSISALLTYLNASIPENKWEEYDFPEVVRGVSRLKGMRLEGDIVKVT